MKILLISPLGFKIDQSTLYAGVEKLVWQYAQELAKRHEVTIMGHAETVPPVGVTLLPSKPKGDIFLDAELQMFRIYQGRIRDYDVVHDFSHQHLASRYMPNLPSLNIFWHAPAIAHYVKAPYNIIGLSQWACREFKRVYRQEARYMQSILIDGEVYKPKGKHGNRFLTLGKMSPEKGNLNAILMCQELGYELDVVGGRGAEKQDEPLSDYEKAVQVACDGTRIIFHGEISEEKKLELMQSCKALIYASPSNYQEVTSHKVQEILLCGGRVVASSIGATSEIVAHGIDGFLCSTEEDYRRALKNVDALTPEVTLEANREKYSIKFVVSEYEELYKKVARGLRW